ncbi:hypothetical protein [Photobacterium leiognathi]|uniref:hypothetical protein n=1 Tax=Photobacterium leiognathi TaxID=553611 RepID=UPI002981F824|nr:hypothetical protein [Photobacterium leiognathi]
MFFNDEIESRSSLFGAWAGLIIAMILLSINIYIGRQVDIGLDVANLPNQQVMDLRSLNDLLVGAAFVCACVICNSVIALIIKLDNSLLYFVLSVALFFAFGCTVFGLVQAIQYGIFL